MIKNYFTLNLKTLLLFCLATIVGLSCRKTDLVQNSDTKVSELKNWLFAKMKPEEFNSINWDTYDEQLLDNGKSIFTLNFQNQVRKRITGVKTVEGFGLQMDTWTIDNQYLTLISKNVNTGEEIFRRKNIDKSNSVNINSTTTVTYDPPGTTLPEVVVITYLHPSLPNTIVAMMFNQLLQQWVPTGGSSLGYLSSCEMLDPNGAGSAPVPGPLWEFSTLAEAEAFFAWFESLNDEEKAYLWEHPQLAIPYRNNSLTALEKAQQWAATQCGGDPSCAGMLLNDGKADALRHTYWNALNKSSMGTIHATELANRHESGAIKPATVSQYMWDLQQFMDLNNNNIGRNFSYTLTGNESIWDKVLQEYALLPSGQFNSLLYICTAGGQQTLRPIFQPCL